jgi:hypothetical protein
MFADMPTLSKEGSVWYVLSMSWIRVWQDWAYYGLITGGETDSLHNQMLKPGKIDNSDITIQNNKTLLTDITKGSEWQNLQLKQGLSEGKDFMLVTPEVYKFAVDKYGVLGQPIERHGIT